MSVYKATAIKNGKMYFYLYISFRYLLSFIIVSVSLFIEAYPNRRKSYNKMSKIINKYNFQVKHSSTTPDEKPIFLK